MLLCLLVRSKTSLRILQARAKIWGLYSSRGERYSRAKEADTETFQGLGGSCWANTEGEGSFLWWGLASWRVIQMELQSSGITNADMKSIEEKQEAYDRAKARIFSQEVILFMVDICVHVHPPKIMVICLYASHCFYINRLHHVAQQSLKKV